MKFSTFPNDKLIMRDVSKEKDYYRNNFYLILARKHFDTAWTRSGRSHVSRELRLSGQSERNKADRLTIELS